MAKKIEVRGFDPYTGTVTWEPAAIMTRVPKSWGELPDGWHRVVFRGPDGGIMSVHESNFRYVD